MPSYCSRNVSLDTGKVTSTGVIDPVPQFTTYRGADLALTLEFFCISFYPYNVAESNVVIASVEDENPIRCGVISITILSLEHRIHAELVKAPS